MAIPTGPANRPKRPSKSAESEGVHAIGRTTDRIPSEIIPRSEQLSPAVMALSVSDFFDLLYSDSLKPGDVTVEEFFRMRENNVWPEMFTAGDPRGLFTEDMCRRGQFVPLAWHAEGLCFATNRAEGAQEGLAKALDLIVKLPVTLYTVSTDHIEPAITWLYRRF